MCHDVKRFGKNDFITWFLWEPSEAISNGFVMVPFYLYNVVNLTRPLLVVFHIFLIFKNISLYSSGHTYIWLFFKTSFRRRNFDILGPI